MTADKIKAVKVKIAGLTNKEKALAMSAMIVVVVLIAAVIVFLSGNSVKGRYDFYWVELDGQGVSMVDSGYMEINGVDNDKTSMFYIDLYGSTCRIKGKVYEVRKFDEYTKYRFEVKTQSGSALEDMEYFYFNYYPDRKENGVIEVKGKGDVELFFEKVK